MLELLSNFWHKLVEIIAHYDFRTLVQTLYGIDWIHLAHQPVAWIITGLVLLIIIISKRYWILLVLASVAAFTFIFYKTVPENPDEIQFKDLITFLFSSIGLIGLNIYFLLIRK
ncbi:MAG: hypothetical protein JRI45_00910 [Deltaproteobacteria bacterium]|nr:hypothetical protein [Deltaproteobacteria bacterium]MBW2067465.1 hypothetical protein [Deltaproteobacteria bacterium]